MKFFIVHSIVFLFSCICFLGCTKRVVDGSQAPIKTITTNPLEIKNAVQLEYSYYSNNPCSEIEFFKAYAGNIAISRAKKIFVDDIVNVHKYEIKVTSELGFLTFQERYKCSYWGLGVEYDLKGKEDTP